MLELRGRAALRELCVLQAEEVHGRWVVEVNLDRGVILVLACVVLIGLAGLTVVLASIL